MTTTLITGATKGLGRETTRQLLAAGHTVYLAARDRTRGLAAAEELGATFVQLDVTDDASVVAAAVAQVAAEAGVLDVLVNNAGIAGNGHQPGDTTAADMQLVFDTNVFGIVRVTNAFLPLLALSGNGVVVNVSSGLGSIAVTTDPSRVENSFTNLDYTSSKSAVNMLTSQYARTYPELRFNAVDPGYTATDLNGHSGPQTVEQGAEIIVRMAQIGSDGPTGGYFDATGPVPR